MQDLTMTIDGCGSRSHDRFDVTNPATGETFGAAPGCSAEQLDAAFKAASRAFPDWSRDADRRSLMIHSCADLIEESADVLSLILTTEQGKPLANARGEAMSLATWFRYYADLPLPSEVLQDDGAAHVEVVHRPMGVVAAITQWNVPLSLAAWKLAPASRAGNTAVSKPSPFTPMSTLRVGELLRDVLPPGVLNVVSGGDDVGSGMTAHPIPRKISLTVR